MCWMRCGELDVFSFDLFVHCLGFIETERAVGVVDEHIEMPEKIAAENSANVGVGCVELVEALKDDQSVLCGLGAGFEKVQVREEGAGAEADADEAGCALNSQVEVGGQGWLDDCDLGAGVYEEVVRAGVVDRERNDYLGALDEAQA